MVEITAALSSARALLDLVKGAVDMRDDAKAKAALAELQTKLFDATSAALAMAEKAAALQTALSEAQREKSEIEAQIKDRAAYALHELVPGAHVYASQPVAGGADGPVHYLCQPCYDKGVKAILRSVPAGVGLNAKWVCPEEQQHGFQVPRTALSMPTTVVRTSRNPYA
jgi:hypothetical protein